MLQFGQAEIEFVQGQNLPFWRDVNQMIPQHEDAWLPWRNVQSFDLIFFKCAIPKGKSTSRVLKAVS